MKNRGIFAVLVIAVLVFFTACGDEDPYEPDSVPTYTVRFEANGGNPAPKSQTISQGGKVAEPAVITRTGYGLGGWYKDTACTNEWNFATDTVTGNVTLYAKWVPPVTVFGASFNEKMRWLDSNVQSGGFYIIEVDADLSIEMLSFSYSGKNNITISLKGIETERIISLSTNVISGSMFHVGAGITLIVDDKLKLQDPSNNSSPMIRVNSGGNFFLNQGARIIGSGSNNGSGVYIDTNGTFTMNGGEISGRGSYSLIGSRGGGVYVASNGTFTMNGGKISGNTVSAMNKDYFGRGGGVYVSNNGTFTMSGGEISGNTASPYADGGGVYVDANGTFIMSGGKISSNTAFESGGGVDVFGGTFTMNGGEISGNTASSYGGGVDVFGGTFTMNSGEISGNTARSNGGGVFVFGYGSTFNKTGGTIFGYSEGDSDSNLVKNSSGVLQSNCGHAVHVQNSNTIYIMGKDTTSGMEDNLSFNGTVTPPAWSGEWDY